MTQDTVHGIYEVIISLGAIVLVAGILNVLLTHGKHDDEDY